jgi:hypothetical protein
LLALACVLLCGFARHYLLFGHPIIMADLFSDAFAADRLQTKVFGMDVTDTDAIIAKEMQRLIETQEQYHSVLI